MITQKWDNVLRVFLFVYAAFAGMLIYLFLFNTGLEIQEQVNELEGIKEVYVYNNTERVIYNVYVKYEDDSGQNEVVKFDSIEPKEKKLVPVDDIDQTQVTLVVESPFHATVERLIVLRAKEKRTLKINFPDAVIFGKAFGFSIEVCNNVEEELIRIEESHENSFFSEPNKRDTFTLEKGECRSVLYSLTPVQRGDTTIYFNVNTANSTEQLQQKLTVG